MDRTVAAVRRFNRFFTRHVGALTPRFLGSELSLAEARLLYEIAHHEGCVASDLQVELGMDAGFVSRVLGRFESRGWITRVSTGTDARRRPILLAPSGRDVFGSVDVRQQAEVESSLERLGRIERADLEAALATTGLLLQAERPPFTIRTFRTGDMGMIAARQSLIYAEYGWTPAIEALIGETTAAFLRAFKPGREQCWVANVDGVMAGSIFLTEEGDGLCRLRLLYVEPFARRLGIGDALVATCIEFAREVGFDAMTLWTHAILTGARRIYAAHGFVLVESKMHDAFGIEVLGETWRLDLRGGESARQPQRSDAAGNMVDPS